MTPQSNVALCGRQFGLLLLLATGLAAQVSVAGDCQSSGDPRAVAAINAERQAFNQAIATQDLPGIERVLHTNAILVTGTDSEVFVGREAQVAIWRADFATARRALYVRTTTCVQVSATAPVAMELGRWRGQRPTAADFAAGSYAAKWRRVDDAWRLEAEIFVTEACGGDFCPASAGATQ